MNIFISLAILVLRNLREYETVMGYPVIASIINGFMTVEDDGQTEEGHLIHPAGSSHTTTSSSYWSYFDTKNWPLKESQCGGSRQSPINIDAKFVKVDNFIPPITFGNYDAISNQRMIMTNNGHSVMVHFPDNFPRDKLPYIQSGGLGDEKYLFTQFHFHWGSQNNLGSEHSINSKRYSAELHIVNYNSKYRNFSEASKYKDGLAILAILIQMNNKESSHSLSLIADQLHEIRIEGEETMLKSSISFKDLLPTRNDTFYRYFGSLTTPGCEEIVTWTVFDTPIFASEHQMASFRKLLSLEGPLTDNYRSAQPLNGRTIIYRSNSNLNSIKNDWNIFSNVKRLIFSHILK